MDCSLCGIPRWYAMTGPEHDKTFRVSVRAAGRVLAEADGQPARNQPEQAAAALALGVLRQEDANRAAQEELRMAEAVEAPVLLHLPTETRWTRMLPARCTDAASCFDHDGVLARNRFAHSSDQPDFPCSPRLHRWLR